MRHCVVKSDGFAPGRLFAFIAIWLLAMATLPTVRADQAVFTDDVQNGWEDDWSWASVSNTTVYAHSGTTSLAVAADAYEAAYFHHAAQSGLDFTNLSFWIYGGPAAGQLLKVQATRSGTQQSAVNITASNQWQLVSLPLSALGVATAPDFDGFWIADRSGTTQPVFYLDDVALRGTPVPPVTNIVVDAGSDRHAISPLIYGVAFALSNDLRALNCPLNRSGGNAESRYNWQLNAHNHANDWYFESIADDGPTAPGATADAHVANSKAAGADAMITIPMLDWTPKLAAGRGKLASYSIAKYGPQTGNDWQWFADAGNGTSTNNQPILTNDLNDANTPTDTNFQKGYVQHLTNTWNRAGSGGVRYYIMDNEPGLWQSTHQDIHHTGMTMQEYRDRFLGYAAMTKSVDPGALVAAPEEWGWPNYFYSGYDTQWFGTNGDYNPAHFPDRTANGGWDIWPWFLNQLHQRATNTNQRLLDVFTLHCYPQGGEGANNGNNVDTGTQLLRNRSTRQLWDTNYVDQSWINAIVMLIPRMKSWVTNYYPSTQIGVTEYDWGAMNHINGATAEADILGIFGRENLDLATRWTSPMSNSPVFNAFRMYRNYDGNRSTFGDRSVRATGPDPDLVSVFAAVRSVDNALTLMIINKQFTNTPVMNFGLSNYPAAGPAQTWRLDSANVIARQADAPVTNGQINTVLPAQSITLFVIPSAPAGLAIRGSATPGAVDFILTGQPGSQCVLEESTNLVDWSPVTTNNLATVPQTLTRTMRPGGACYRAEFW